MDGIILKSIEIKRLQDSKEIQFPQLRYRYRIDYVAPSSNRENITSHCFASRKKLMSTTPPGNHGNRYKQRHLEVGQCNLDRKS